MSVNKENKFVVFKIDELQEFFKDHPMQEDHFKIIIAGISDLRVAKGKIRYNSYIVCNQNEPYADKVWQVILEGELQKENKLSSTKELILG